jgi:hypothetical protein
MNKKLLNLIGILLCSVPSFIVAQSPTLGTAADFILFSSIGAVTHSGSTASQLTGNIGGNANASTGFGNVDGIMQDKNNVSAKCSLDLLSAYQQLKGTAKTMTLAPLLGNGQILGKGVYEIGSAATLNLGLTLDAKNDKNAVFIFKVNGAFSTHASSKIYLINKALACNVFWMIEGQVDMATGTTMRGTVIANNAAIVMAVGDTLEGRAMTTNGAITVSGILGYKPIGCGSPILNGPTAPVLGGAECFALFSSMGDVANSGITNVMGDVGSNTGMATGFDAKLVNGTIHQGSDTQTKQAAIDLLKAYNYANLLTTDIELLYPNLFGNNLVLTPHTYYLNAATNLKDTVYLNAQGNANAVFVIKINGAFSTSVNAKVKLINGTQSQNVYWAIKGAVTIAGNSSFEGTIMNDGAIGSLGAGGKLNGRVLTVAGALNTSSITASANTKCIQTGVSNSDNETNLAKVGPNPFNTSITISWSDASYVNETKLMIYNTLGDLIINNTVTNQITTIDTRELPSGIYFYKMFYKSGHIQTGKIISQ